MQKTVNGVVTKYTLHGKNVVHMTSGADELHFFYDAQNRPAVVVYNGVPYAYVKSLQGDVIAILDAVGNVVVSYAYDAWGAPIGKSGALAETLPLSPSNVYGQHKLEAEARVLARCPDAVALRLPWMYDLPGYHLPIRGNLPLNILKAAKTGEVLRFSRNDYRGVGYVREVIENLIPAMELPGGVYNFGSECDGDMVETARCFANLLQVDVKIEESDLTRNLAMDTGKLRAQGIEFSSTWGALRVCLGDYRLGYLM